jgi:hypothetical protein
MAPYATALEAEVVLAQSNNAVADIPRLEGEIRELWERLEETNKKSSFLLTGTQLVSALLVAVVVGGIAVTLWTFVSNATPGSLSTIDGARPIITLAAIISTVGFGASLVLAALFASDANFETRFRTAREIFLVFSGVFATVVGFHFGAGQSPTAGQTAPVSISRMSVQGGKLNVFIEGGVPPYVVEAEFDGVRRTAEGASPVAVELGKEVNATKPISKAFFKVTDKGKMSETLPLTNLTLSGGWERAPVPANAPASGASTPTTPDKK